MLPTRHLSHDCKNRAQIIPNIVTRETHVAETPTILITSADIKKIEHERSLVRSEVALQEARLRELFNRRSQMDERLALINNLLTTLGAGTVPPGMVH